MEEILILARKIKTFYVFFLVDIDEPHYVLDDKYSLQRKNAMCILISSPYDITRLEYLFIFHQVIN
jgi:hypothetical protein